MGISSKKDELGSPQQPSCACREHLEDVRTLVIPNRDWDEDPTFEQLLETGPLGVRPLDVKERFMAAFDEDQDESQLGPLDWVMWAADEIYGCYDDDAGLPLDKSITAQPGVEVVEWFDREEFLIGAPGLREGGMLATIARALQYPRIRT